MIIPTIAAVTRDVFLAIPDSQREAALALGATEWETIWQVLIPYGLSGILGAVILGLGRALGETMAVTMVIGNSIEGGALPAAARLHHGQHHRQRICRGGFPTAHGCPDRNWPGPVRHDPAPEYPGPFPGLAGGPPGSPGGARMSTFSELMNRNRMSRARQRKAANAVMLSLTGLVTVLALVPLFWIIGYVIIRGGKNINLDFFIHLPRPMGMAGGGVLHCHRRHADRDAPGGGLCHPAGGAGCFLRGPLSQHPAGGGPALQHGCAVRRPIHCDRAVCLCVLVVPMGHYSGLAGGVALAVSCCRPSSAPPKKCSNWCPHTLREASLALGAPEWKTSLSVLFPAASSGIITGFLLALARAAGETAPLLLTALGNERFDIGQIITGGVQGHQSVFTIIGRIINQPVDSLPLTLWKYAQQPYPERVEQAWAVALVLMLFVLIVNVTARVWIQNRTRRMKG